MVPLQGIIKSQNTLQCLWSVLQKWYYKLSKQRDVSATLMKNNSK